MNKFFVILLITLPLLISAQNKYDKKYLLVEGVELDKIDNSEKELLISSLDKFHKAKEDSLKVKALAYFAENSWDDNLWPLYNNWVYNYVEEKLKGKHSKAYTNFYQKTYVKSMSNKGFGYMVQGNLKKALTIFYEALELAEKTKNETVLSELYNNIAGVYEMQAKLEEALDYYGRALKILQKKGFEERIGPTLNNIAAIYDDLGDVKEALKLYKEAIIYYDKVGDMHGKSVATNNIGLIYSNKKDYDKAIEYYTQSLEILEQHKSDRQGIATTMYNIGELYSSKKDYDAAINYFKKTLELFEEINARQGASNCYRSIGKIYYKLDQTEKAIPYMEKSYQLALEIAYPSTISSAAQSLSRAYVDVNRWKEALDLYKLHIKMKDSLTNDAAKKAAAKQQAKYEYEKQKALDDAEHEKEIAIEKEAKEKQTIITYATGGGLGLVGIFLLIVFNRLKVTRKQKNIIEEQKQEVEKQKTVVELAHSELEEKNKEITDSIQYAKRIQNAILPPNKVVKEYLTESFILYKPKDIVAGDFYWLEQKDNKVLFAAADCTGHGVPGAMVSVVCNNGLNRSVREYGLTDPGKILDKTREIVVEEFEKSEEEVKDGMDIALCSLEGTTLQYAGAHNPLWIIRNGELLETKANKQPIGKFDNPEPYTTHTIELQKGDSVYIFSDGYADQFGGEKGKKLKTANFKKLLLSIQNENMQKQKELIDDAFENWKGELEQLDDVCVIGVRV